MAFLTNLMFSRLDRFDGSIFERLYIGAGGYIRGVNWVTYLGDIYSGRREGGSYTGRLINEILRYIFL